MNAYSQVLADPVAAAVDRADRWVTAATPLIKAYFALEAAESALASASYDFREAIGIARYGDRPCTDAEPCDQGAKIILKASRRLYDLVEGVRETFVSDEGRREPDNASDDEAEACEEHNARLGREVVSVDAAVRRVGASL